MKRRQTGITLIEMLIVGLISVILGLAVVALVRNTYESRAIILDQNNANANARAVLDDIADRVRGAQFPEGGGSTVFVAAGASSIQYYDYIDLYDRTQSRSLVQVRFFRDGDLLKQTVNGVTRTLMSGVQSLQFTYHLRDGSSTTTPASGQLANILAITIVARVNYQNASREIRSFVQIRAQRPAGT